MADRRDYSGRRSGPTYKEGSYYHRKNAYKKSTGILPYQIAVCTVLLLCLLGGWMTDAQWFAEGKQLLLVQINAADQTKRVGNMLSGILKRDETEKQAPATTPDAASLSPPSDQAQQAGVSPEKLKQLYRYIEQYGKSGEEEQAASTGLTGMGGYLPVSVSRYWRSPISGAGRVSAFSGGGQCKTAFATEKGYCYQYFWVPVHPITGELDFHTGLTWRQPRVRVSPPLGPEQ